MPKELQKGFRISEGGVEKVRKAELENRGRKMKGRLPSRPNKPYRWPFPAPAGGRVSAHHSPTSVFVSALSEIHSGTHKSMTCGGFTQHLSSSA